MVYFVFMIFVMSYLQLFDLDNKKNIAFLIYIFPVFILFLLLFSLQSSVGHDYGSYYRIATGVRGYQAISNNFEYAFVAIIALVRSIRLPQLIFFFSSLIQLIFFFLVVYELKKLKYNLVAFFFLFFTLSLLFFNQFSGLRQYIAIYIILYAILKLINHHQLLFIGLVLFASLFHISAIIFLLLVVFKKFLMVKIPFMVYIIIFTTFFIVSLFDLTEIYNSILSLIPQYRAYADGRFLERTSIQGIITKIPKLIIVVYSLFIIRESKFGKQHLFLINLSMIATLVMIMSFNARIVFRFYQYFDLFMLFPVLHLFDFKHMRTPKLLIVYGLFVMLIIKIILLPQGEYLYSSILF
jgi:hypothetical protein